MARLMAAMSGGVDSSVAAALAVRAGHDVTGITLKQWSFEDEETRLSKGCCTLDAVDDARRACRVIGIPHYTLDLRDEFTREVVDPFVDDYAHGLTPNPCVRCNERVRFGAFLERALRLGFDGVVTGHYARVENDAGRARLYRARCAAKDQSYVLYAVSGEALARAHFPLGDFTSKHDVRDHARRLGLPNADRADSVEVCFVGEGRRPGDVVAERAPAAMTAGPILSRDGAVVGEHRGLAYYTIGQRRGLGASGTRRYVTALLPERNAVVVGDATELGCHRVEAVRPRFVSGVAPADGTCVEAVVRYQASPVPARFASTATGFVLELTSQVRAPAPGQAVVLYSASELLGGGTISTTSPDTPLWSHPTR